MKISKKRKSLFEKIVFSILLSVFAVFVFTVTGCDSGKGFENYSVDECYATTKWSDKYYIVKTQFKFEPLWFISNLRCKKRK